MTKLASHFMISESDGALYDTRRANWYGRPTRQNYQRHVLDVESVADLKACLRAGPATWPGGYPIAFYTSDGAALSYGATLENFGSCVWSIKNEVSDGWRVIACAPVFGFGIVCDHTGLDIYGEPD